LGLDDDLVSETDDGGGGQVSDGDKLGAGFINALIIGQMRW